MRQPGRHRPALDTAGFKPGQARLEDRGEWNGRELFFRVRLFSQQGQGNGWSEFATLGVIAPIEKPSGLQAEAVEEGVRLTWAGPDSRPA